MPTTSQRRSALRMSQRLFQRVRRDLQAVVDSNRITLNMRNQVNKAVRKSATIQTFSRR